MPVVVRTSISNHHPSGKRKKPKPRHNAPCLRQLVRYKLYEIRLDTLKKRRYAPAEPSRAEPSRAEPSRAEPSRAEPSRAIFAPSTDIVKPSFQNCDIYYSIVADLSQNRKPLFKILFFSTQNKPPFQLDISAPLFCRRAARYSLGVMPYSARKLFKKLL